MRLFTLFLCSLAYAQEFDVASIKVSAPFANNTFISIGPPSGGPGTNDPTHFTWPSATVRGILQRAYEIKAYQISGPDWLGTERFDIAVVIPEGAAKEQVAVMWRNLLASRFGVKVRKEKKEFAVDELVVGPRGHKLQASNNPNAAPLDKDGKFKGGGIIMTVRSGPNGVTAQANAVAVMIVTLADLLSNQLGHPVVDKTGLIGKYDFSVDYAPGLRSAGIEPLRAPAPVAADLGLDLVTAIQQQLGLRLEHSKGLLDYIVVEKVERIPTEN
jgi:uncharacterized protein (TIGR03435 family)